MGVNTVSSRGELEELEVCPVCKVNINLSNLVSDRCDDNYLMPDKWKNYFCLNCLSIFINPRPKIETLPNFYRDYLTHEYPEKEAIELNDSFFWSLARGYLKYRFNLSWDKKAIKAGFLIFSLISPIKKKLDRYGRNLRKLSVNENARLLDLGCGAGGFLKIAKRMGFSVVGCDFDEAVVNLCRAQNLDVRQGGLEVFSKSEDSFDAITMNQVLEHVVDPEKLIHECYEHLNKNGSIWIALPNPNAVGYKVFGSAWAGLHAPYHLSLPSQKMLIKWLENAGFMDINLLVRGWHSKVNWKVSQRIANNHNIIINNRYTLKLFFVISNFLSLLSPKWGEETVIAAKK